MTDFLVQQCGVEICKKFECKAFVLIVFSQIKQECFLQIIKVQQISIVLSEYSLFIDKSLKIWFIKHNRITYLMNSIFSNGFIIY